MGNIGLCGATLVTSDRLCRADLYLAETRLVAKQPHNTSWDLDVSDHWIFPGLVNAHDHLQLNCIPHLPQRGGFSNSYAWARAFPPYFGDAAVAAALAVDQGLRFRHGALKNLLGGATTVAHHDPLLTADDEPGFPVRLLRDFGWSHSLGLGAPAEMASGLASYGPPVLASFAATPAHHPWMIHLAEGTDRLAASELQILESMGCLARNTVLIHGVGLSATQIQQVIDLSAGVVWCPSSNLRILSRTLDPRRLFDAGKLALGTDSRLTGSRDLLAELRVAADHSDLTPRELLRLVTGAGAAMLRLGDVGGLAVGQRADLLVLRRNCDDPYRQLINTQRGDIRAVVRGGVPMIADPDFAAWFAALGIDVIRIELDGHAKLLSSANRGAIALEPGARLVRSGG